MIQLYRRPDDPSGRAVEAALRELVVAHSVTLVSDAVAAGLPSGSALPAVREAGRLVTGSENVGRFLEELRRDLADWNRFQGDSCYIDPDGAIC